jgi:hypothetical protein
MMSSLTYSYVAATFVKLRRFVFNVTKHVVRDTHCSPVSGDKNGHCLTKGGVVMILKYVV